MLKNFWVTPNLPNLQDLDQEIATVSGTEFKLLADRLDIKFWLFIQDSFFELKSSQNKKGQKNLQVHSSRCLFLQLAAEKKTPKPVHLEKMFGPSYFEAALRNFNITFYRKLD